MGSTTLSAAIERAKAAGAAPAVNEDPDGRPRTRRIAIGDPQAPLAQFLEILDGHRLLGVDGMLMPDVFLVSMGDHFDWGKREQREQATNEATALLAWLAAHPPDQVAILLGNHDLGRVGELARFDDRTFAVARSEADVIYGDGKKTDSALETRYRELHPDLPTTEIASRDFSTFAVAQRNLVMALLDTRRFRIAHAVSSRVLLCHAGVTNDDLDAIGMSETARGDAILIADALDGVLEDALAKWDGASPLSLGPLHVPGSAKTGEGRGIFYHRPSNPAFEDAHYFEGPPRRRFDPRRLPGGIVQAIGHIRDGKCRALLRQWHDGAPGVDGPLRHLATDGSDVSYARGVPARWDRKLAGMIFTDNGMSHAKASEYELLDLTTLAPAAR